MRGLAPAPLINSGRALLCPTSFKGLIFYYITYVITHNKATIFCGANFDQAFDKLRLTALFNIFNSGIRNWEL